MLQISKRYPGDKFLFSSTGRIFLWFGDNQNANVAFQQEIVVDEGVICYTNTLCNGCGQGLTPETKSFVSKACRDVDLCEPCYETYYALAATQAAMAHRANDGFLAVRQPNFSKRTGHNHLISQHGSI